MWRVSMRGNDGRRQTRRCNFSHPERYILLKSLRMLSKITVGLS